MVQVNLRCWKPCPKTFIYKGFGHFSLGVMVKIRRINAKRWVNTHKTGEFANVSSDMWIQSDRISPSVMFSKRRVPIGELSTILGTVSVD